MDLTDPEETYEYWLHHYGPEVAGHYRLADKLQDAGFADEAFAEMSKGIEIIDTMWEAIRAHEKVIPMPNLPLYQAYRALTRRQA